ncbi:MAG: HEAT repeat domain-containing protein, partial [Gemmataceae bacterium]
MTRHFPVLLLLTGPALAADPDPRSWKDVFGKPRPHGEPVSQAFVGLHTGRTNLHFVQPMAVELFAVPATDNGPYVHPRLTHSPNVKLELIDAAGKVVPFRMEGGGSGGGPTGEWCPFTLWPTKGHAAGSHWKPGKYTLKATVTNPDEPANPNTLPGTFKSNELAFTVREFGAALDTWNGKDQLRRAGPPGMSPGVDVLLLVAGLDEASVAKLREQDPTAVPSPVAVAGYAPVIVPQDRKLTDEEVAKLLAGLKDDDPAKRVRALVSVPPTATPEVLAATLRLLDDPYKEWAGMVDPVQVHPLSTIAAGTLSRLGPAAVEPLIAYAGAGDDRRKATVAAILGPTGPTEAGEKFLRAAIVSNTGDLVSAAQKAAAGWGQGGLTITRAIVADPKIRKEIRRDAIVAIGQHGDLKADGPTLRPLLATADLNLQGAAVTALGRMKDVESLPEFERIARDSKINQNTRYPAVHAVLALADAKT